MGNKHPLVANSDDVEQVARWVARKWISAILELSWAQERPGTDSAADSTFFEEQILVTRVRSCMVRGKRQDEGTARISLWLEVDTDADFANCGKIKHVILDLAATTSDNVTVCFRTEGALVASGTPGSITARLKRVDKD